ncbi:MAG TPA: hypothetical protein VG097_08650 [Gemmata sp.]|jgi:hypothetical protein|nr:hypothetical protein [Gemmata sp.]
MQVNVNIIYDFTMGIGTHNLLMPPVVPKPNPTFAIEIPATQMWTMGYLCGQNKFTNAAKPVFHKGVYIALDGHNQGMLIPDVTIPPSNAWYAVMWPFSSRKIMFSASTVQMNGTNVACSQLVGLPPLPQLDCGDPVSLPYTFSMITFTNTLTVGMTLKDLIIGVVAIAVSIAIDLAVYFLGDKFKDFFTNTLGSKLAEKLVEGAAGQQILGAILGKLIPGLDPGETLKRVVGALTDFGISALKGNPSFQLSVLGNPDGGAAGAGVGWSPSTGVTGQGNLLGEQKATGGTVNNWGTPVSAS